jgi:hypothetical protein
MLCFTGDFTTNFLIPEFLGLGKQSARGFGVVRKKRGENMIPLYKEIGEIVLRKEKFEEFLTMRKNFHRKTILH